MPKVSIIIPCYGVEEYLDRCLDSVVNQTLKDIEIVLVDDVSPDRVPEMCDNWSSKDSRIKVIHKHKNEGLGLARNSGLDIATGEYIAFLDSDDFVDVTMYEKLYIKAQEMSFDIVYCNCSIYKTPTDIQPRKDVDSETTFVGRDQVDNFLLDIVAPNPEYNHDVKFMMSVWHGIYKHDVLRENNIRFISERILVSEDLVFDIQLLPKINSICYIPDCLHYYVVNPKSLSNTFSLEKYNRLLDFTLYVERQLSSLFDYDVYIYHYLRSQFFMLRNSVKKFIKAGMSNHEISRLINDDIYNRLFSTYPFQRMDFKHKLLFVLLKYRFVSLIRILSKFY